MTELESVGTELGDHCVRMMIVIIIQQSHENIPMCTFENKPPPPHFSQT